MSGEDPAAVVRRMIDLYNALPSDAAQRAESEELRELLLLFDDGVEFVQDRTFVDLGDVSGRKPFSDVWGEWLDSWEEHRSEIERMEVGGERVLVFSRDHLRGRDGVAIDMRGTSLYTVRAGRITRMEVFGEDHDAAWGAFKAA
jgi:ketosteroid isomerase-like protein